MLNSSGAMLHSSGAHCCARGAAHAAARGKGVPLAAVRHAGRRLSTTAAGQALSHAIRAALQAWGALRSAGLPPRLTYDPTHGCRSCYGSKRLRAVAFPTGGRRRQGKGCQITIGPRPGFAAPLGALGCCCCVEGWNQNVLWGRAAAGALSVHRGATPLRSPPTARQTSGGAGSSPSSRGSWYAYARCWGYSAAADRGGLLPTCGLARRALRQCACMHMRSRPSAVSAPCGHGRGLFWQVPGLLSSWQAPCAACAMLAAVQRRRQLLQRQAGSADHAVPEPAAVR